MNVQEKTMRMYVIMRNKDTIQMKLKTKDKAERKYKQAFCSISVNNGFLDKSEFSHANYRLFPAFKTR